MRHAGGLSCIVAVVLAAALNGAFRAQPNPYRAVENWARMPEGRTWGSTSAVAVDSAGTIWVGERCGQNSCAGRPEAPVLQFDPSGRLLNSFGEGLFIFPHGMHVDMDDNVWLTDAQGRDGRGHQVFKFSQAGKVMMTLGKPGEAGEGPDVFNQPSDVVVVPGGDIFVADGHGTGGNNRIVKFTSDGRFVKSWGGTGSGPGEFSDPHALALDSQGRLFVGDRANNRIQIFDQDGRFLEEWKQFGRPSGIYIDRHDTLYVTDSESNTRRNPGGKRGIYVGSARDGKVTAFIPDPEPDPDNSATSGAEGVAADAQGTIYAAEVGPRTLRKYVRQ